MWRDILLVGGVMLLIGAACYMMLDQHAAPPAPPGKLPWIPGQSGGAHDPTSPNLPRSVRIPNVKIFSDSLSYTSWYSSPDREGITARTPNSIDFHNNQAVVIQWGDKPGSGYALDLVSVVAGEDETVVTVKTTVPKDDSGLPTSPGVTVATSRSKRVKVVVTGDRLPADGLVADFIETQTVEYYLILEK